MDVPDGVWLPADKEAFAICDPDTFVPYGLRLGDDESRLPGYAEPLHLMERDEDSSDDESVTTAVARYCSSEHGPFEGGSGRGARSARGRTARACVRSTPGRGGPTSRASSRARSWPTRRHSAWTTFGFSSTVRDWGFHELVPRRDVTTEQIVLAIGVAWYYGQLFDLANRTRGGLETPEQTVLRGTIVTTMSSMLNCSC